MGNLNWSGRLTRGVCQRGDAAYRGAVDVVAGTLHDDRSWCPFAPGLLWDFACRLNLAANEMDDCIVGGWRVLNLNQCVLTETQYGAVVEVNERLRLPSRGDKVTECKALLGNTIDPDRRGGLSCLHAAAGQLQSSNLGACLGRRWLLCCCEAVDHDSNRDEPNHQQDLAYQDHLPRYRTLFFEPDLSDGRIGVLNDLLKVPWV